MLPVPLVVPSVIHGAASVARVHGQVDADAVSVAEPLPPPFEKFAVAGARVKVHPLA